MTRYNVEKLDERLNWMMANLDIPSEIKTKVFSDQRALVTIKDLIDGLAFVMDNSTGRRQIDRYRKGDTEFDDFFVNAVLELFPGADKEMLIAPKFDQFLLLVSTYEEKVTPWLEATRTVSKERGQLAKEAKKLYANLDGTDEIPDWMPLVMKNEWLIDAPLRITEDDAPNKIAKDHKYFSYDEEVADIPGRALWTDGPTYRSVKLKSLSLRGKSRKAVITNGPTFRMIDFEMVEGRPSFTFAPGEYFNYVDGLEALAAEFARYADTDKYTDAYAAKNRVMRGRTPESIFELTNRSAFPGVNCLLIVENFEGITKHKGLTTQFAIHDRGNATIEAPNCLHVVPSGGHQPQKPRFFNPRELSIWWTVVGEFIEELFDKEERVQVKESGVDFYEHPKVKPLIRQIFQTDGHANIYYLGMGYDPLTTKPEILVCVVINWKKIAQENPSFERLTFNQAMKSNYEGGITFEELSVDNLRTAALVPQHGKSVLPAGAACMLQAAREGFLEQMLSVE